MFYPSIYLSFFKNIFFILIFCTPSYAENVDYEPVTVKMDLIQVSDRVYYVQGKAGVATFNEGFISNASAVITSEGIVVIDSLGTPSLASLFLKKLREISQQPIVKVIVSHYHADHIYGLQVFKDLGAKIIAPAGYTNYLDTPTANMRLEERRHSLFPWVNQNTRLMRPDQVIDNNISFTLGDTTFDINYLGSAHSDGDLSVLVKPDNVLISGDLIFEGRVPFTGNADTKHWLSLLNQLQHTNLTALIPGHGAAAQQPDKAIKLTRHYLNTIRKVMKLAVDDLMSFDEAFASADWSEFEQLPAYKAAHRKNAYGVFLSIEQELLNQ